MNAVARVTQPEEKRSTQTALHFYSALCLLRSARLYLLMTCRLQLFFLTCQWKGGGEGERQLLPVASCGTSAPFQSLVKCWKMLHIQVQELLSDSWSLNSCHNKNICQITVVLVLFMPSTWHQPLVPCRRHQWLNNESCTSFTDR